MFVEEEKKVTKAEKGDSPAKTVAFIGVATALILLEGLTCIVVSFIRYGFWMGIVMSMLALLVILLLVIIGTVFAIPDKSKSVAYRVVGVVLAVVLILTSILGTLWYAGVEMPVIGKFDILFSSSGNGEGDSTGHDASDAYSAATQAVESRLKSPSTADFCGFHNATVTLEDDQWIVDGYVDAQNSFGAELRNNFRVIIQFVDNDTFNILECSIY